MDLNPVGDFWSKTYLANIFLINLELK